MWMISNNTSKKSANMPVYNANTANGSPEEKTSRAVIRCMNSVIALKKSKTISKSLLTNSPSSKQDLINTSRNRESN